MSKPIITRFFSPMDDDGDRYIIEPITSVEAINFSDEKTVKDKIEEIENKIQVTETFPNKKSYWFQVKEKVENEEEKLNSRIIASGVKYVKSNTKPAEESTWLEPLSSYDGPDLDPAPPSIRDIREGGVENPVGNGQYIYFQKLDKR